MESEKFEFVIQVISTIATSTGVLILLYFSLTKAKTRYNFFCKIINQKDQITSQKDYSKIAFGFISGNDFDIGIQQVGIDFMTNPFWKPFYTDFINYDENTKEKSKVREIYYKTSNAYFSVKEFNDRWDKKVYIRPYVIDMSGRVIKMSRLKMVRRRFKVQDFAYRGIPKNYFNLL